MAGTYQLMSDGNIIRLSDGATIPLDPANRDRAAYNQWVAAGGVPDPAPVALPMDLLDMWDLTTLKICFNHENRIRALESKAAMTAAQFKAVVRSLAQPT